MPEIQLDDLTLIVIQPGQSRADLPRQFGSVGVVAANGRRLSHIGRLASDIGWLARTVPRLVNRQLAPRKAPPVRFHPQYQSDTVYAQFLGHLTNRSGEINHHLGGFILKFRRIPFTIIAPRHFIPVLSP